MFQIFKQPWVWGVLGFATPPLFFKLPFGMATLFMVMIVLGIATIGALAAFIESENHIGE